MPNAGAGRRGRFAAALLAMAWVASCRGSQPSPAARETRGTAHVTVTRPAVIAYFVIPPGAVDTLPDLAVEADDWNVSMATLRDSLDASGLDLAMVTDSSVRISVRGARDTTLSLGSFKASGFVFIRADGVRCVRAGGADPDSVKALARAFAKVGACAS